MLTIATWLNEEEIEYMPGVIGWNKARLKRIIEDERYMGKETYPAILDEEAHTAMQQIKEKRNTQKDTDRKTDIFQIAVPVKCPNCGRRMIRKHDSRYKVQERWLCENEECRTLIKITDTDLLEAINGILAGVTSESIRATEPSDNEPSLEVRRLNSDISRMLGAPQIDKDALRKKMMECISQKYKDLDEGTYYVENNHPAIIDAVTFGRVQEELARRSGKPKTKKVGTKTEQGKYSSKYALTELLVCGECKTPYRRCTWTVGDQKKIVWRCINRLDFGKKYCHNSPTIEESILQRAVMTAIMKIARQNLGVLQTLKTHIGMGLETEQTEDNSMEIQIRIAEIDAEFKAMLSKISTETVDAFDEEKAKRLMDEKTSLQRQLGEIRDVQLKRETTQSRLDDIYTILDGLKNRPMEYDEQIVRQLLECITVDSKEQITVIFIGGLELVQPLLD